jgi:hypothetical protein
MSQGRFLTKSDAELRQQWENEGGYEFNMQRVRDAEAVMLAVSPTLANHVEQLPADIQRKAMDHLRLPTGYGLTAARLSLKRSRTH